MQRTRGRAAASGCLWMIVLAAVAWGGLAAVAWGGLGLSGGPRSPGHASEIVPAAAVVDTTPPRGLELVGGPDEDGW